jgi:uncharacterized protein YxeA
MKTSNKLLLALLAIVIVGVFIVNVIMKNRMDSQIKSKPNIETGTINDSQSSDSDSIAMEKAMENE